MELEQVTKFVRGSQTERLKIATKLAFDARRRVKEGDLSVFLLPLIVAIVKDGLVDPISDIPIVGQVLDVLLSFPIAVYLFIFMWGRGKWKMRVLFFFVSLLDIVPIIDLIPFTTVCVLYARHLAKEAADVARDELAKLDATMRGLSRKEQIELQRARMEAEQETAMRAEAKVTQGGSAPEMNRGGMALGNAMMAASLSSPSRVLPGQGMLPQSKAMDGVAGVPAAPQNTSIQMRGQAANDDRFDAPQQPRERVVSRSDIAPVRSPVRVNRQRSGSVDSHGVTVLASSVSPSTNSKSSDVLREPGFSHQRIVAQNGQMGISNEDMRKKIREMVREEYHKPQTDTVSPPFPIATRGDEKRKIASYSGNIKPDLQSDPTLLLFSRLNNPAIQEQMVDLLLKNEDYRVTETEKKWVNRTDADGKLLFDPDTDMPIEDVVEVPRFHNYTKKTRAELTQEVQERVKAVTQLGGEKNAVYLFPEIKDRSYSDAAYSPKLDEVFVNSNVAAEDNPQKKLTPKQLAVVLAHEKGHQVRRYHEEEFLNTTFQDTIDFKKLSYSKSDQPSDLSAAMSDESLRDYMNAGEIAERMSQLKNYFGFKGNEIFTKEHLDYARDHYVDDVFDNNMAPFLRAVTPEKESKFIQAMNMLGI